MPDFASGRAPGPSVIDAELITLDTDLGADRESVIATLAGRLTDAGRATDRDALTAAVLEREAKSATGLPGGIAIPHCRHATITTPSLGFARLSPKVDFGAPDGPADLVFLIAAPEGAGADHMRLLTALARALVRPISSQHFATRRERGDRLGRGRPPCLSRCHTGRDHRWVGRRKSGSAGARTVRAVRGRSHRLPHRNRPHLHGCRCAHRRSRTRRNYAARRDAGFERKHPDSGSRHRCRRRRDLRYRCGSEGQRAVRRQAGDRLGRQTRDQRTGRDGHRSPACCH